jgi:hypothetical protein
MKGRGACLKQVALVTGHKDWKMLRRYTHLKPEGVHKAHQANAASSAATAADVAAA